MSRSLGFIEPQLLTSWIAAIFAAIAVIISIIALLK
jgi:hypothetical protein